MWAKPSWKLPSFQEGRKSCWGWLHSPIFATSNPTTRDELLEKCMGYAYEGMGRTLDTHISNLRKKIEPDASVPTYVQTVYGVGYRLAKEPA